MYNTDHSFFPAPAPVIDQPAADVRAPGVGEGSQVTYTYPIRQPENDFNDFQVGVRASVLKRCRERLKEVATQSFPFSELLLGISTLFAGAALSALVSGVNLGSWRGVLFFVILPMVAVGTGVAYGMQRRANIEASKNIAQEILNELPDPDRSIEVRPK
ncbi:MAG: hypothetical protein GX768_04320 [Chloroflexi bacterium]|jgi:hypothetical protein|nr:hypothetical protein [Chloroflexota bacterium]